MTQQTSTTSELIEAAKETWPMPNPPMDMGVEDGIVWAICRGRLAGVDGYAMIPTGHPWSDGVTPEEEWCVARRELKVHGGICLYDHPWVGFDTTHAYDFWDSEYDPNGLQSLLKRHPSDLFHPKDWTVDKVIEEAKGLARQLASIDS
jgi:hypothetical protein